MKPLYIIEGIIIEGKKRGRQLGFPTINIQLHQKVESGIYVSHAYVDNKEYMAASFIGEAKTFDENDYKLEGYILDFDEEIYGKKVTVKLYKKLRDNTKYSNVQDLIEQIKKDVHQTREFFS